MPGLLSGLFDGSDDDLTTGETTIEESGDQPVLVPEDLQPQPVGILGDEPNEGAAV